MVDWDRLKSLFQLDLSTTITNINLLGREGDTKIVHNNNELNIYLSELDDQERREIIDIANDHIDQEGRLLRKPEEDESNEIEGVWGEKEQEILEFFDGIVIERYVKIIEKSLYLRGLIRANDLPKHEIDERKRDLAERYGGEALYISNLCTSGYFDRQRIFREMYQDMFYGDEYDHIKFNEWFQEIVTGKLLCVFVDNDQPVYEVKQDVRGRLARYQREDPPQNFLDIRGIGGPCRTIIDKVVAELKDEFGYGFDCQQYQADDGYVARISPASLPPLGSNRS